MTPLLLFYWLLCYSHERERILRQGIPLDTFKEDSSLVPLNSCAGSLGPFLYRQVRKLNAMQLNRILPDQEIGDNIPAMLGLEHEGILPLIPGQNIILFSALQSVTSTTSNEPVTGITTGQEVIPARTFKVITTRVATHDILAIGTPDPVLAIGAREFLCSTFRRVPPVHDVEPVCAGRFGGHSFGCCFRVRNLCGSRRRSSLRFLCRFRFGSNLWFWLRGSLFPLLCPIRAETGFIGKAFGWSSRRGGYQKCSQAG